jgi:predicted DCC family thiol-disulfide oxidoreductase YuxK
MQLEKHHHQFQESSAYLFYDSKCPLCLRFKDLIQKKSSEQKLHIQFLDIHNLQNYKDFPQLTFERCQEDIHFIDFQGQLHVGSNVISAVRPLFPDIEKYQWLIQSRAGEVASEFFYQSVSHLRKKLLQRQKKCQRC